MEVIVTEDHLSLAIGKKGQNVRLATRLVGWDIDIVSENLLKKEITQKMGKMMASGEVVTLESLQGVTAAQAADLKAKNITDIDALAATSLDDLVEILDISLDAAEEILSSANGIVEARNAEKTESETAETVETETDEAVEAEDENSDAVVAETEETTQETVVEEEK